MRRLAVLAAILCVATTARAQELPPAADSAIQRAVQLAAAHDSVAARRLVDSLASARESTPLVRGEAVYWSSRFAPSSEERERILGTLLVDHPFSPRTGSALRELGMLELARNDRDRAAMHLGRYLTAAPDDSGRASAALVLGRLLMERGELPRACAVLLSGRTEVPEQSIELRNQFEFSAGRCQGVDTTSRPSNREVADTAPAPRRTGAFTVQVAAYDTKQAAEKLATSLRGQGLEARVVGTSKPYRVRVGRYATRGEAEIASDRVDAIAKSRSIVVIVGPEER
ncbi:MAG TPA: SPOR domain-containing protein [Gemmatimonadaceae bacterium]|nr:SPOR domain-containing protein [Gemmatimonadaceae bacterium]